MSEEDPKTPPPITKEKEDEELPSLPKRPVSPFTKLKGELTEAFPNLEDKLITAIMILSQGQLDQSFNALLYYNDPSTLSEEEVKSLFRPKLPSRESSQLQKDEAMAKKLARKYSKQERYNRYLLDNDKEDNGDSFESFLENDLPQLKQQLNKNLEETSTKISNWFGNLNKKFNENTNNQGPALFSAIGGGGTGGTGSQKLPKPKSRPPRPSTSSSSNVATSRSRYDYDSESIINQTDGITLNDNTQQDIYGTPKTKKNSFETTTPLLSESESENKKKINAVKPEPIVDELTDAAKKDDDDFLVDDSDEDN